MPKKLYDNLRVEEEAIQQRVVKAKNARVEAITLVICLLREFEFAAGILKSAFAKGRVES